MPLVLGFRGDRLDLLGAKTAFSELAMLEVNHGYQSRPGLLAGSTDGGCPG